MAIKVKRCFGALIKPVIVFVIFLLVVVISLLGSCNPWKLEPSRVGPRITSNLPKITPTPNATNYLLLPQYENNLFALHISLPDEYIHPSNRTSEVLTSYSFHSTMYYPEMTGVSNPKNEHLRNCRGYCEGYVSALIEAVIPGNERNIRQLASLYKDQFGSNPAVLYKPLSPVYGFEEHFVFSYPMIEKKFGDHSSTTEYFIKRHLNGEPEFIIECLPYVPSPGCQGRIKLALHPEIEVWIGFGMHLLPEWQNLVDALDQRISKWSPTKYDLTKTD